MEFRKLKMKFKEKFTIKQGIKLTKALKETFPGYCAIDASIRAYQGSPREVVYVVYVAQLDGHTQSFGLWSDAVDYALTIIREKILMGAPYDTE